VETVVVGGEISIFGITKKYTSSGLYWDELGHTAQAFDLDESDIKNIVEYVKITHKALDFQNTITHTEFRLSDKRPIIMEINPRLAGDYIYYIQEKSIGISTCDLMLQAGLGVTSNELKNINLYSPKESWSVRFLTETKHVRVIKENSLSGSEHDKDVYLSNYVDAVEILLKPVEAYGNRVGAIIGKTDRIYPELKYVNTYQSEESLSTLEGNNFKLGVFHVQQIDLPFMYEIENIAWSSEHASSLEIIQKRFEANSDEHLICVDMSSKKILGFFSLLKVCNIEMNLLDKWENLAALSLMPFSKRANSIENFIICGVSLTVSPSAPKGVGHLLIEAAIVDAKRKGAQSLNYTNYVK
jgi:hypothetical protein